MSELNGDTPPPDTDPMPELTFSDAPETPRSFKPGSFGVVNPRTHILRASWADGHIEVHATYLGSTIFIGNNNLEAYAAQRVCVQDVDGEGYITVEGTGEIPEFTLFSIKKLSENVKRSGCETFALLFGEAIHGDQAALQELISSPHVTDEDLEVVKVVCTSMIDQLLDAIKSWPNDEARTRIARLAPTLYSGLLQLGDGK